MSIRNINFENISIKATSGFTCIEGDGINLNKVNLEVSKGNGLVIINGKNLEFNRVKCAGSTDKLLKISGKRSQGIKLLNMQSPVDYEMASDVSPDVIIK